VAIGSYAGWQCGGGFGDGGTDDTWATNSGTRDCMVSSDERYTLTTKEEQYMEPNALGDLASGFIATLMAYANDLLETWQLIVLCGAGVATVGAAIWVFLMKICVKPLVYLSILSFLAATGGACVIGLYKSGMMESTDDVLAAANSTAISVAPEDEQWLWHVIWIVSGLVFLVSLVLFCMKFKKIRQATSVIKEASNALSDMPLIILFPIFPLVVAIVLFAYFLVGFALIMCADTITMDGITSAVTETVAATTSTTAPANADAECSSNYGTHCRTLNQTECATDTRCSTTSNSLCIADTAISLANAAFCTTNYTTNMTACSLDDKCVLEYKAVEIESLPEASGESINFWLSWYHLRNISMAIEIWID
jgi:hypothetical protein